MLKAVDGHLVEMTFEDYRRHPAFSASTAKTLIAQSPAHAQDERRRGGISTRATDKGSIAHMMLLGKGAEVDVLRFDSYRTKAAQSARDEAHKAGRIPILEAEYEEIAIAVDVARQSLAALGVPLDGASEQTVLWTELDAGGPQPCRCRVDHLRVGKAKAQILEIKTAASAAPADVQRSAENMGYAIATAAYTRAVEAALPQLRGAVEYYFVFFELEAPYAINMCTPDEAFLQVGSMRWERAVRTWRECEKTKRWPSYGDGLNTISVPRWVLSRLADGEEI